MLDRRPVLLLPILSILSVLLITLVSLLGTTRTAHACSPHPCLGGATYLPFDEVPANLGGLLVFPYQDNPIFGGAAALPFDPTQFALIAADGERISFTRQAVHPNGYQHYVLFDRPLRSGMSYRVEEVSLCSTSSLGWSPTMDTITVGPAQPLPNRIGSLTASPSMIGTVDIPGGASCTTPEQRPLVNLELTLSAEAEPWAQQLVVDTYVDGQRWDPRFNDLRLHFAGPNRFSMVYAKCDPSSPSPYGTSPGRHQVHMEVTIPGQATSFQTNTVQIDLICAGGAPDMGTLDMRPPPFDDGGQPDAAGSPDAGVAADGGALQMPSAGGCTCARPAHSRAWITLLLSLGLLSLLRIREGD